MGQILISRPAPPALDTVRARKVITALVYRKLGLFNGLRQFSPEDLIQEGLIAVEKAWFRYDFWRAAGSNFVYLVAERWLISLWRSASADKKRGREFALAAIMAGLPTEIAEAADKDDAARPSLEQWAATVARAARKSLGRRKRPRSRYTLAQSVAIGALMHHGAGNSPRGYAWLLTNSRELRRALGLKHVPGHNTIRRAGRNLPQLLGTPRR